LVDNICWLSIDADVIPTVPIKIFTDTDIETNANDIDDALKNASVLLCSLIFDYNQVQFIKEKVTKYNIPVIFYGESAAEATQRGDYSEQKLKIL
jgi:magnesium chelatase subunit H